ncbi:MAG: flagellar hook-length control protein FliK [Lachnospiraceae bacterium]|nr:flagellar hook-length control protein FliK [Lachnospiraceae bacterium]
MGTGPITNLVNDFTMMNTDIPKSSDTGNGFAKTFESASGNEDLGNLAKRDVNVVEELKTNDSSDAKDNYLKETSSKSVDRKVENKTVKTETKTETKSANTENARTSKSSEVEIDDTEIVETVKDVVAAFCEVFNITPEELSEFLTDNDIAVTELLDTTNVQDIVMQFNGIDNTADILTNDVVFDAIKNLEDKVAEITKGMEDVLNIDNDTVIKTFEELNFINNDSYDVIDDYDREELNPVKVEISEETIVEAKDDIAKSAVDMASDTKREEKNDSRQESDNHLTQNVNNNQTVSHNDTVVNTEQNQVFSSRAQEIYNQIGEYIRNLSSENIQEIEMRLQPETLGTLHVKITQSEGVMKAEFITQNENVRAAVESQLIQLKEDFDRSGIRVDEVEVRVSTNEFNEATQQDSRDEENEAASRNTATRRINLTDGIALEDIDEYEEEEKITVEMMTANGNSLDYKA